MRTPTDNVLVLGNLREHGVKTTFFSLHSAAESVGVSSTTFT